MLYGYMYTRGGVSLFLCTLVQEDQKRETIKSVQKCKKGPTQNKGRLGHKFYAPLMSRLCPDDFSFIFGRTFKVRDIRT